MAYLEAYEQDCDVLSDSLRFPIGIELSHLRCFFTIWFVELAWVHDIKTL